MKTQMSWSKFAKMKQLLIAESVKIPVRAKSVFTKISNFVPFWVDLACMYRQLLRNLDLHLQER